MNRTEAERFAEAAKAGYSEQSLVAAAGGLDRDALAIAKRDYLVDPGPRCGGGAPQSAMFTAQVASRAPDSVSAGLRGVAVHTPTPVSPFHTARGPDQSRTLQRLTEAVQLGGPRRGPPAGRRRPGGAEPRAPSGLPQNRLRRGYPGRRRRRSASSASPATARWTGPRAGRLEARRAVAAHALAGYVMTSVGNATHFHVRRPDPGWGPRLLRVAQIGLHVFYRFGGMAAAARRRHAAVPGADNPQAVSPACGRLPPRPSPPDRAVAGQRAAKPRRRPPTVMEKSATQAEPTPATTLARANRRRPVRG